MDPAREEMFMIRGPRGAVESARSGAKAWATSMGPTALVSKLACIEARVRGAVAVGLEEEEEAKPALLTRMSRPEG